MEVHEASRVRESHEFNEFNEFHEVHRFDQSHRVHEFNESHEVHEIRFTIEEASCTGCSWTCATCIGLNRLFPKYQRDHASHSEHSNE